MNVISPAISRGLSCPSNEGIAGGYPCSTSACGVRTDSSTNFSSTRRVEPSELVTDVPQMPFHVGPTCAEPSIVWHEVQPFFS
jgi:hypothetical protein